MLDLDRILDFIASNARLLDRRRAELAVGAGDPQAALAVLAGYRNADGGFGWALEPDLRSPASQPVAALHAFEVLEEVAPVTSPLAPGCSTGSMPSRCRAGRCRSRSPGPRRRLGAHVGVGRNSVALAPHDRRGAGDPAPGRAPRPGGGGTPVASTRHGLGDGEIAALDGPRDAIEFRYVLQLLDALNARDELERLGAHLPANGTMAVTGGKPDEAMRPLDFSPEPGRPMRALFHTRRSRPTSTASRPNSTTTAAGTSIGRTGRPPARSSGADGRQSARCGSSGRTAACERTMPLRSSWEAVTSAEPIAAGVTPAIYGVH